MLQIRLLNLKKYINYDDIIDRMSPHQKEVYNMIINTINEFIYLQDFPELDEDNEEFSDDEPEYVEINKENISIGDYIGIECERFGDSSCHLQIVDIQQRYNEITGEPYKIVIDEDGEIWSTQSGNCLSNTKTFYEIYGYFRKLESYGM